MFDCCLKVKICKILSFIAQKGLLLLEPVAYGQKVTIKMTFPKSYDYKPSCKHVISTPGLSKFHMLCSKHIIFLLQDGQSKESSFLARKKKRPEVLISGIVAIWETSTPPVPSVPTFQEVHFRECLAHLKIKRFSQSRTVDWPILT